MNNSVIVHKQCTTLQTKSVRLTSRQKRFCEIYASNGNASESARLAGYSIKASQQAGSEVLSNPVVVEYLATLTATISNEQIACSIARQKWWTSIMYDETQKMADRIKASEILGRAQGDFIQNIEVVNDLAMLSDEELDEKIRSLTAMLM
jgi:phage terminase small subunit